MSRLFRDLGNETSRAEKEEELNHLRKYLLHWAYSGFVNKPRNNIEIARDTTDFTASHEQIADEIHNARDRFRALLQELNPADFEQVDISVSNSVRR